MKIKFKNTAISTIQGDITKFNDAEAIVNSVGSTSSAGSGINAAIQNAAGKELMTSYTKQGGCKTGEDVITPAFNLPCMTGNFR